MADEQPQSAVPASTAPSQHSTSPVVPPRDLLEAAGRRNAAFYWGLGIFMAVATATSLAFPWLLQALGAVGLNIPSGIILAPLGAAMVGWTAEMASGPIIRRFPWSIRAYRRALKRLDAGIEPVLDKYGWPVEPDPRAEAIRQARQNGHAVGSVLFIVPALVLSVWLVVAPWQPEASIWTFPLVGDLTAAGMLVAGEAAVAVHTLRRRLEERRIDRIEEAQTGPLGRADGGQQRPWQRGLATLAALFWEPDEVVLVRDDERRVERGRGSALRERVSALEEMGWEVDTSIVDLPDREPSVDHRSAALRATLEPASVPGVLTADQPARGSSPSFLAPGQTNLTAVPAVILHRPSPDAEVTSTSTAAGDQSTPVTASEPASSSSVQRLLKPTPEFTALPTDSAPHQAPRPRRPARVKLQPIDAAGKQTPPVTL